MVMEGAGEQSVEVVGEEEKQCTKIIYGRT